MGWQHLFALSTFVTSAESFLPASRGFYSSRCPMTSIRLSSSSNPQGGENSSPDEIPREIVLNSPGSGDMVPATSTPTILPPQTISTPKLITFNTIGTLIQLAEPMGMHFREVLLKYSGLRLPRPDIFDEVFNEVYDAKCKASPCFGCGESVSSADWWKEVVRNTYLEVGVPADILVEYMEDVFPELYHEYFTGPGGWELTNDALYVLEEIGKWKTFLGTAAPKVGVISNFDERLHVLLESLGIAHHFDFVLTSKECGMEKPSRQIFDIALTRCGIYDRTQAVHVGADFEPDIGGAAAAGWNAVFVKGPPFTAPEHNPTNAQYQRAGDLARFLDILGIETDPERVIITTAHRGIYE